MKNFIHNIVSLEFTTRAAQVWFFFVQVANAVIAVKKEKSF
jgi:hypothetical protein